MSSKTQPMVVASSDPHHSFHGAGSYHWCFRGWSLGGCTYPSHYRRAPIVLAISALEDKGMHGMQKQSIKEEKKNNQILHGSSSDLLLKV